MKKTTSRLLFLSIAAITVFIVPTAAQDIAKDLAVFSKKFQDAYNKHDTKALKMMYAEDAVRIAADGTTLTGNTAIAGAFAKMFADNNTLAIVIKQDKATQDGASATATGVYHVTGTGKAGDKVAINGSYVNTVAKVNGHWKILKSVLTSL